MKAYTVTLADGTALTFTSKLTLTHVVVVTYTDGTVGIHHKSGRLALAEAKAASKQAYLDKYFPGATARVLPLA